MRAVRQYAFGAPSQLRVETVADPAPGPGCVRIVVAAAGVHLIDTAIRRGEQLGPAPLPDLPVTPGREVAGTVDGVGEGVDDGWLGRRVVAHLGPAGGGYAELAVAPVEALHALPDGLDPAVAVAMIGTGRTAVAILDLAAVHADDVVLVTSAAGGLGSLFVQAALAAGATVVGVAGGADKCARVAAAGAAAVDHREPGWPERAAAAAGGDAPFTLALDGVGGAVRLSAVAMLGRGGRLVHFGWSSRDRTPLDEAALAARGVTATAALDPRLPRRPQRALETDALAAAAAGRLVPPLTRFALADAAAAHAALEARETVGKTVLIP